MIVNDICKQCGGICCKGEISGLPQCAWLTETGCIIPPEKRDNSCNHYPFVIIEDKRFVKSQRVLLDTGCPYYHEFEKMRDQIKEGETYSILILPNKKPEDK